jgi:hypothetical protein
MSNPNPYKLGPGPGRPKGTPNGVTIAAREAIHQAFVELGGVPSLVKWAQKSERNRGIFYGTIWTKILPHEISGLNGRPIVIQSLPHDETL